MTEAVAGYLIRNARVVTMDDRLGILDRADILIRGALIEAVGVDLDTPERVEVVDGSDMIAMPGMVESHTHMWNSMHRGIPLPYFELSGRLGPHYRPHDSYAAVRLAAAEALLSGITTLHNYAHNNQSPEHTDAEIQAMIDSGARGRYSYAWYQSQTPEQPIELGELTRVQGAWNGAADGRIRIGYGSRNDIELVPEWPAAAATPDVLAREWRVATELELPIVLHAGDNRAGLTPEMSARGYIRDGMLLVHGYYFDSADLRVLAEHNIGLSTCPLAAQRAYMVLSPIRHFLDEGVTVCYSFDATYSSGSYDMFRLMRSSVDGESVRLREQVPLRHDAALRASTIDAAEAMGMAAEIGSITSGKRADIVLLKVGIRLSPVNDPIRAIVDSAGPADVDTVFVDGQVRKRAGRLVGVDVDRICEDAHAALDHVTKAAGLSVSAHGSVARWTRPVP